MTLQYLDASQVTEHQYADFLRKFYGNRFESKWARYNWYKQWHGYRVLLALENNSILGQSCAFNVSICENGIKKDLWWSVDTFVLKEYRGCGVGKHLQQKLFEDFPNFSSASYSKGNGIIKRKFGAVPVFQNRYRYYAVSSFWGIVFSLARTKLFKNAANLGSSNICHKPRFKYLIPYQKKGLFLDDCNIDDSLSMFVNNILDEQYDWYVERNLNYLKWKYENNPSVNTICRKIVYDGETVGFVAYSTPQQYRLVNRSINGIKIFDILIKNNAKIAPKDVMRIIVKQNSEIDGILSNIPLHLPFGFVYHELPLLAPFEHHIHKPYLTLMDHDMEQ